MGLTFFPEVLVYFSTRCEGWVALSINDTHESQSAGAVTLSDLLRWRGAGVWWETLTSLVCNVANRVKLEILVPIKYIIMGPLQWLNIMFWGPMPGMSPESHRFPPSWHPCLPKPALSRMSGNKMGSSLAPEMWKIENVLWQWKPENDPIFLLSVFQLCFHLTDRIFFSPVQFSEPIYFTELQFYSDLRFHYFGSIFHRLAAAVRLSVY